MNERHLSLQSVYQDPTFSEFGKPFDAKLRTDDGTEFKVYSVLLSKHSEFFETLFSIEDDGEESTTIHRIDPGVFETVLIYLYTSRVNLTTDNMLELLVASDFLLIESLVSECRLFILRNRKAENCVRIFLTARRIQEFEIEYRYRRFFLLCFEKALQHSMDIASDFPYSVLKYFLGNRSLNITGERVVWSLIKSWVEKDPSNRMQNVPELLRFLSMDEIEDDVASDMISSPIILQNQLYEDMGDPRVTLAYLSDKQKAHTIIAYRNEAPVLSGVRQPQSVHFFTKRSTTLVEMFITYDENLDLFRKIADVPYLLRLKLFRVEHRIYIIEDGAGDGFHIGFKGYFYDIYTNETKPMAPDFPGHYKLVVEVSGHIYAYGEFSAGIVRYVEETDNWIKIPLIDGFFVLEVVSLNGCLYIIGCLEVPFVRMKLYDPSSETIVDLSSPSVLENLGSAAVVFQERIFLFRVYWNNDHNLSSIVEVYDPLQSEWELYPELLYQYLDISTTVWKGRLYVYDTRRPSIPMTFWEGSGGWKKLEDSSLEILVRFCRFCSIEGEDLVREVMKKNKEALMWRESGIE